MTNQYFLARFTGRDPNLRAADADREQIAERLRRSHSEGRLDMDEFQERLERCYAAKTFGQLDQLVRDLPRVPEADERRSPHRFVWWQWRLAGLAPLLIVLVILAAASGHHAFWAWVVVLFILWRVRWWRRRHFADGHRGTGDWI
jgi:hypothetical protein